MDLENHRMTYNILSQYLGEIWIDVLTVSFGLSKFKMRGRRGLYWSDIVLDRD